VAITLDGEFLVRTPTFDHLGVAAPTPIGETQLDAFHPYGCVKRLMTMPASRFDGTDLFLRIHLAQKEGFISVVSEVHQCCAYKTSSKKYVQVRLALDHALKLERS
jgi:hypothetical protein